MENRKSHDNDNIHIFHTKINKNSNNENHKNELYYNISNTQCLLDVNTECIDKTPILAPRQSPKVMHNLAEVNKGLMSEVNSYKNINLIQGKDYSVGRNCCENVNNCDCFGGISKQVLAS